MAKAFCQHFFKLGLQSVVFISQPFYLRQYRELALIVVKAFDDILVGGVFHLAHDLVDRLFKYYVLGTVVSLPGSIKCFGLTIEQDNLSELRISADDELDSIEPYFIIRLCRKQFDEPLNAVELAALHSIIGSLGFLEVTVNPFADFLCSYLQQSSSGYCVL